MKCEECIHRKEKLEDGRIICCTTRISEKDTVEDIYEEVEPKEICEKRRVRKC